MWTPEQYVEMDRAACAAMRAAIGVKTFSPEEDDRRREEFRAGCAAELERRQERTSRELARREKILRHEAVNTGKKIRLEVCQKYDFTIQELTGISHRADHVRARREVWYRLQSELGWSTPRIGRFMNRDPSTVCVGIKRYREATS